MNAYSEYKKKLVSPEVAVCCVKSGDWVDYGFCLSQPMVLDAALAKRKDELLGVKVRGGIARHPNMITINSCIEADILGQVTSETSGPRQISGTGGQLDFINGGYLSEGGQSFVCCASTYKDKEGNIHSRIRPSLPQYSVVTNPRTEVHCIVTEWGIADLAGRSVWERAERLINIAHPDYREELFQAAEKLGFRRRSNKKQRDSSAGLFSSIAPK